MFDWDLNYPRKVVMDSTSHKLAAPQPVTLPTNGPNHVFFLEKFATFLSKVFFQSNANLDSLKP